MESADVEAVKQESFALVEEQLLPSVTQVSIIYNEVANDVVHIGCRCCQQVLIINWLSLPNAFM
jgi:hypothetical protein